jgi:hypothetical protein
MLWGKNALLLLLFYVLQITQMRESSEYLAPSPPHETILVDMTLSRGTLVGHAPCGATGSAIRSDQSHDT